MKAIAFAVLYTVALSNYMSTLSFAEPPASVAPVQHAQPAPLSTSALVLDRLA